MGPGPDGGASKSSTVRSKTQPTLLLSSPIVRYQVVLPPACRSPVPQHVKKLNVVRRWLTMVALLFGVERIAAPAVLSHHRR